MKTLIGCCLIHLCIGSIYALSVLYNPIMETTGWDISVLVNGFAVTILALGLIASLHQRMFNGLQKRDVLYIAIVTWCFAQSLSLMCILGNFPCVYYISSFLLGTAIGLLYVIPINIITDYGFKQVGRASGAVVCCFGLGSIIASKVFVVIPLDSLIVLYALYAFLMILGVQLIQCTDVISISSEFNKDKRWYVLAGIFFLNIGIGISLLSNLVRLSTDKGLELSTAIMIVALAGVANTLGRLVYSSLSDYSGRFDMLRILLWIQLTSLVCITSWDMWTGPIIMIISVYGGVFAIMPSLMKELYESTVPYSQVLIMWGFAGLICPILFSYMGMGLLIVMSVCTIMMSMSLKLESSN